MSAPLWSLTATELAQGFRAQSFTPDDALAAVTARLEAVNPTLNAVIARDPAAAQSAATAATARCAENRPLSPLDGVPLTIKDNLHAAGLPASWGSRAYNGFTPQADEPPVARLRAAGAVIIGKTNVPEFTVQGFTDNLVFGPTSNPHAPGMTPGGSTGGGAAAVAAGIGPIAIGTDGGGSLRRPAAHCGLFAFKPSIGQIARHGGFPAILADFETVGPVARSVEDLLLAFTVLRGFDPRDPRSLAALAPELPLPATPRIGLYLTINGAPVDPRIVDATKAFAAELAAAGCIVEDITAPYDLDAANAAWGTVAQIGLAWHLDQHPDWADKLGANAQGMAQQGRAKSAGQLLDALAFASEARVAAAQTFEHYDLLLTPAIAALAWPASEAFPPTIAGRDAGPRGHALFTGWANLTGLPAATVPVGMTEREGGIGVQLIAGPGRDLALLHFLHNAPAVRSLAPAALAKGLF